GEQRAARPEQRPVQVGVHDAHGERPGQPVQVIRGPRDHGGVVLEPPSPYGDANSVAVIPWDLWYLQNTWYVPAGKGAGGENVTDCPGGASTLTDVPSIVTLWRTVSLFCTTMSPDSLPAMAGGWYARFCSVTFTVTT